MASIKTRVAHSHLGGMSNKELKKLFDAALVDLAAVRSDVSNVVTQFNTVVTELRKISNNQNAPNNTVQLTSAAVSAPAALTLTA